MSLDAARTSAYATKTESDQRLWHQYMTGELRVAWKLASGYRLQPWRSPYLKWRIETWSGIEAGSVTPGIFLDFCWQHRTDLRRYLRWAVENST